MKDYLFFVLLLLLTVPILLKSKPQNKHYNSSQTQKSQIVKLYEYDNIEDIQNFFKDYAGDLIAKEISVAKKRNDNSMNSKIKSQIKRLSENLVDIESQTQVMLKKQVLLLRKTILNIELLQREIYDLDNRSAYIQQFAQVPFYQTPYDHLFSLYPVAVSLLQSYQQGLLPLYYQQSWMMSYPLATLPPQLISPLLSPIDYFQQFRNQCHVCWNNYYVTPIVTQYSNILQGAGEIGLKIDRMVQNVDTVSATVKQVINQEESQQVQVQQVNQLDQQTQQNVQDAQVQLNTDQQQLQNTQGTLQQTQDEPLTQYADGSLFNLEIESKLQSNLEQNISIDEQQQIVDGQQNALNDYNDANMTQNAETLAESDYNDALNDSQNINVTQQDNSQNIVQQNQDQQQSQDQFHDVQNFNDQTQQEYESQIENSNDQQIENNQLLQFNQNESNVSQNSFNQNQQYDEQEQQDEQQQIQPQQLMSQQQLITQQPSDQQEMQQNSINQQDNNYIEQQSGFQQAQPDQIYQSLTQDGTNPVQSFDSTPVYNQMEQNKYEQENQKDSFETAYSDPNIYNMYGNKNLMQQQNMRLKQKPNNKNLLKQNETINKHPLKIHTLNIQKRKMRLHRRIPVIKPIMKSQNRKKV